MVACLLNVWLALHSANVPIATVRNVVAGGNCPITTENKVDLVPYFYKMKRGQRGVQNDMVFSMDPSYA